MSGNYERVPREESDADSEIQKGKVMARILALLLIVTVVAAFFTLIFHLILTDLDDSLSKHPSSDHSSAITTAQVIRPKNNAYKYKYLVLPNGLRVMLINTGESQATLGFCVGVGSNSNPLDYPGLAHYTEHAIFSGSKKYPSSGYFLRFIERNGGHRNAFTSFSETIFNFVIEKSALEKGLELLADLMKNPIFTKEHIEKEKVSVQNEYEKYLSSHSSLVTALIGAIGDPTHPSNAFDIGNKVAFDKQDYRDKIMWFHEKYYKANLMSVIIAGDYSTAHLEAIVKRHLSDMEASTAITSLPTFYRSTHPKRYLGQEAFFVDERYLAHMNIFFPIAWTESEMERLEGLPLVEELLQDGLKVYLEEAYLASSVYADFEDVPRSHLNFKLSIYLTKSGLCNRDMVLDHVFEYIDFLKKTVTQKHIDDAMKEAQFKFLFSQDVSDMSALSLEGSTHILNKGPKYIFDPPKRDAKMADILLFLNRLTPRNMNLVISVDEEFLSEGSCFETTWRSCTKRHEQWFKIDYYTRKIPEKLLREWETIKAPAGEKLPFFPPKLILPTNLKQIPKADYQVHPEVIKYEYGLRSFWYACSCKMMIHTNIALHYGKYSSPRQAAILKMAAKLIDHSLETNKFIHSLVGVEVSVKNSENVILLSINGFSDMNQYNRLIQTVTTSLLTLSDTHREDFVESKRELIRTLDAVTSKELELADEILEQFVRKEFYSDTLLAKELRKIQMKVFLELSERIMSMAAVRMLIVGNIEEAKAKKITNTIIGRLEKKTILTDNQVGYPEVLKLPRGRTVHQLNSENSEAVNNAVAFYWQLGPDDVIGSHITAQIMGGILEILWHSEAYLELRTKQQIGYHVSGRMQEDADVDYFVFKLRGTHYTMDDMTKRGIEFIDHTFRNVLVKFCTKGTEDLPDPEKWFKKMISMSIENLDSSYDSKLYSRWPYFNKDEYLKIGEQQLKVKDLLKFYDDHIIHGRTLILQIYGEKHKFMTPTFTADRVVTDIKRLKKELKKWEITTTW